MWRWVARVRLRWRSLLRGHDLDVSLEREIQGHIEEHIAENLARGMSPDAARAAALRAFGSTARVAEECRHARGVNVLQNLGRDLRYTFRSLARQPLLAAAATVSIGAAMAANGVVLALVDDLLLAPPTTHRPDRLVYIQLANGSHVSFAQWRDLEGTGALAGLAGYQLEADVNWTGPDRSISVAPLLVTPNFFDVTGVPVATGRPFTAKEVEDGQEQVVVISHRFWKSRLAADPAALGRVLTFNGRAYTVVGILPRDLRAVPGFGLAPEVYLPLSRTLMPDLHVRNSAAVELIGRLKDQHSVQQGRAALQVTIQHFREANGSNEIGDVRKFAVAEGVGFAFKEIGLFFIVLTVAVGLVLAISCANVAGLLMSRATVTAREVGLRAALGASRARLVQQFLSEAFWIALAGTAAGLALSYLAMVTLSRVHLPLPLPVELHPGVSGRIMLVSLGLLVLTTAMCGLLPAIQATRGALVPALKQEEPRFAIRRWTVRRVLVTGQVAVALVLLVTAFLFLRNLTRARDVDPGFDTTHTAVAQVSFVEGRYTPEDRARWLAEAVERLRAMPGVTSATYSHGVPLMMRSGIMTGTELRRADRPSPFPARYHVNLVGPAYFETMGIDVVGGREFLPGDRPGSPVVAVINEEFAGRHFPGEDPVGKQLLLPGADRPYAAEIVGVVRNAKYRMLGEDQQGAVYEAYLQRGNRSRLVHVLVRTEQAAEHLQQSIEVLLSSLDRTAAVEVMPMRTALKFAFLPSRIGATLLGSLGAVGLVLAVVGLYAAVAYAVSRRTAEIGIRMALGASTREILRFVLAEAALLSALGIAIGLAIAWLVTAPLGAFLVAGLSARDPVTFAATPLLLFTVSLLAALIPARRATRIDPVGALRRE